MKIEIQENSVRLIPENGYEMQVLDKVDQNKIKFTEFEDNEDKTGYLQLNFCTD